jgi:hypothetical protein
MTELQLKNRVGIFLIIANILVIITTLILFLFSGFLYDEMTTTISLIVPMFSVYSTAIIKSIIENKRDIQDNSQLVTSQYVFISWFLPIVFTIYLIALIFLKAFNIGFTSFEQFKGLLVASETIFGAYVGLIVSSMFNIKK